MERTITVTGTGKMAVQPDHMRIELTLEGTEQEYGAALEASSKRTGELQLLFAQQGLQKEELKTTGFHIDTCYEDVQVNGEWKNQFKGYRYYHRMKAEFPVDNTLLGRLLGALGESGVKAEISLQYYVADQEKVKAELLKKAVACSKEKAELICSAAGVTLGDVLKLEYSWAGHELAAYGMRTMIASGTGISAYRNKAAACDLNVQPDDILIEDSVVVTWGIC